jgi:hypothetical protein
MKNTIAGSFAALVVAAAIAGCSNGNLATSVSTPTPVPLPSTPCVAPAGKTFQVLFPPPSPLPSAASDNQGILVGVSPPTALPTNYYGYVSSVAFGTAAPVPPSFLSTTLPSPAPTPTNTPVSPNETVEYVPFGIFAPGTTWTVYLAQDGVCFPGFAIGTFAS